MSKKDTNYQIDIEDYQIVKRINEGAYGVVYLVRNWQTSKQYAAKVLKKRNLKSTDEEKVINNEVKILKLVHHTTITRFYGVSPKDFDGNPNYTMIFEFYKNGSLENVLEKIKKGNTDRLFDNTARQIILIGIARAMMLLHRCRVVHLDLKPGNVLLDDSYFPHLTDFGLSQCYQKYENPNLSNSDGIGGTSIYMAPEVIESELCTLKADVYSFGILMFEILTGCDPYPELTKGIISKFNFQTKVISGEMRPKFTVPIKKSLRTLIMQCLEKIPERRPTFDDLFAMLAYGHDNALDDEDDQKLYYLDNIDIDSINDYVNMVLKDDISKELINSLKNDDDQPKKSDFTSQPKSSPKQENPKVKQSQELPKDKNRNTGAISNRDQDDRISQLEEEVSQLKKERNQYQKRMNNILDQLEDKMRQHMNLMDERFQILSSNLTSVEIPGNMTKIGAELFMNFAKLQKVVIPPSVKVIESYAFAGCSSLTEINIPDSVTLIDKYAFAECTSLKKIVIPPSVTKIEKSAFRDCRSLQEVSISPETSVGNRAFAGCTSLQTNLLK